MWVKFSEYSKAKHKKISFLFCILFDLHYLCNQIQKMVSFSNITLLNLLGLRLTGTKARKVCSCYQA